MLADGKIISLEEYKPGRRWVNSREIHVLFISECCAHNRKIVEVAMKSRNARLHLDYVSSPDDIEACVQTKKYSIYVLEQWLDETSALPLIDACLQDRAARTIILADHPEAEEPEIRQHFPSALVMSRYDLDGDMLVSVALDETFHPRKDPANPAAIEGLLQSTASIRTTVTGIWREMMAADVELDRGETDSGQSHLTIAMRRLSDVESALKRMEHSLVTRLRLKQTEEKA